MRHYCLQLPPSDLVLSAFLGNCIAVTVTRFSDQMQRDWFDSCVDVVAYTGLTPAALMFVASVVVGCALPEIHAALTPLEWSLLNAAVPSSKPPAHATATVTTAMLSLLPGCTGLVLARWRRRFPEAADKIDGFLTRYDACAGAVRSRNPGPGFCC